LHNCVTLVCHASLWSSDCREPRTYVEAGTTSTTTTTTTADVAATAIPPAAEPEPQPASEAANSPWPSVSSSASGSLSSLSSTPSSWPVDIPAAQRGSRGRDPPAAEPADLRAARAPLDAPPGSLGSFSSRRDFARHSGIALGLSDGQAGASRTLAAHTAGRPPAVPAFTRPRSSVQTGSPTVARSAAATFAAPPQGRKSSSSSLDLSTSSTSGALSSSAHSPAFSPEASRPQSLAGSGGSSAVAVPSVVAAAAQGNQKGSRVLSMLMGTQVAHVSLLTDDEGNENLFFVFYELSVRTPGLYRLRFALLDADSSSPSPGAKAIAWSNVFEVFSPKVFPGMTESTALSRAFARQGVPIHIRRRRPGDGDDVGDYGDGGNTAGSSVAGRGGDGGRLNEATVDADGLSELDSSERGGRDGPDAGVEE
ncbi:hypothetical protein HK405_011173, partial [Cladochytrium tenue]